MPPAASQAKPPATRSDNTRLIPHSGHSLHSGLSAPPTASQASVPGVVRETHDSALMAKPLASKPRPKLFHLTYKVRHELFYFFLPHFLGAHRSEWLLLPKRAAALGEGTQWCKGGAGKAEDAKLQDPGISSNH